MGEGEGRNERVHKKIENKMEKLTLDSKKRKLESKRGLEKEEEIRTKIRVIEKKMEKQERERGEEK